MQHLAVFVGLVLIGSHACADLPQRYIGVVRREGTGKPVPNVPVSANVDPAPSLAFWELRTYTTVARTRTDAHGRFGFTLAAPRQRLWFKAAGMPTIIPTSPNDRTVILGDTVIRQPHPNTLNVIEVPKTFRPRTKSLYDLTARRAPNQAMQLTASKPAVYTSCVCRPKRMLRGMHKGLAAADLVSR